MMPARVCGTLQGRRGCRASKPGIDAPESEKVFLYEIGVTKHVSICLVSKFWLVQEWYSEFC